jgi:hypothetical protein
MYAGYYDNQSAIANNHQSKLDRVCNKMREVSVMHNCFMIHN